MMLFCTLVCEREQASHAAQAEHGTVASPSVHGWPAARMTARGTYAAPGTVINAPAERKYLLTADHCFVDKTEINNFRYWRAPAATPLVGCTG
jgi:hypothetical protein